MRYQLNIKYLPFCKSRVEKFIKYRVDFYLHEELSKEIIAVVHNSTVASNLAKSLKRKFPLACRSVSQTPFDDEYSEDDWILI